MDPLSDVLSTLQARSFLSSRFEGQGRWAFRFPAYSAQIKFGAVLAGRLHLKVAGMRRSVALGAGDVYLLSNGRPFVSASDPALPAEDGVQAYRSRRGDDGVVRYMGLDGGGASVAPVSLASGRFALGADAGELLLRHLPPLIHLPADDAAARPLAALVELLRWETAAAGPGHAAAGVHLAALVMVQVLRAHLARTAEPAGWLGAVVDRRLGPALAALHADVARRWTVEDLAACSHMSRTAFAVRFRAQTGLTPMDYLVRWRMALARQALRDESVPLGAIAERIGYQSETAFSAAFSRACGTSPGRYRSAARALPHGAPA